MATAPKPKVTPKPKVKAAPKPKTTSKPNAVEKLIQDVTNRYRVTAREARDIVTAVGTVAKIPVTKYIKENTSLGNDSPAKAALKNLGQQIKETGKAAATGKKGTKSDRIGKLKEIAPNALFPNDDAYISNRLRSQKRK